MDPGIDLGEPEPHKNGSVLYSPYPQVLAALRHLDLTTRISFEDTRVVGTGAFGDVSKAQCTLSGHSPTLVAIKRLRFHREDDLKSLFEKEICIWAKLKHSNILPLLGYALDKSGYPLIVSEWMVNGSAWDYALNNVECDFLKLATGISEGLMYIHQMDIIHSDIKPANIVVSKSGEARICDFGSSHMVTATPSHSLANPHTKIQGTPHYLSYEIAAALNQGQTKGSDVWAFGMTIFALLAHQHPYAQIPKEHVSAVIASRKLPAFPSSESSWTYSRLEARDIFWSVCQLCWDHNLSTRADMGLITSILRDPKMHDNVFKTNQLSEEGALYEYIYDLLAVLESISKAIDDVSAIHPNLKSALEALSTLAKNVSESSKTDKKVVDLCRNILKAFEFAEAGGTLRRNLRLLEVSIICILQKTEASFKLVSEPSTSGRLLDAFESERLNELIHALLECKKACTSILSCHDAVVRDRKSEEINIKLLRELLAPNESYDYDSPSCLENTRVEIRREIIDWANAKKSPNVLWLHGVAGSGKSTISRTIAEYFRGTSQLGAFIFFEREKSDPSSVIPTIAFQLAKFDSSIGARIVDQVKMDKEILSAKPALQFSKLLLQPISASPTAVQEPVVVILDALDECGVSQKRRDLIQVLRKELRMLPHSFRVFVTSRQEADIVQALSSDPSSVRSIELDCTSAISQSDVLRYIQLEMRNLVASGMSVPEDWPWDTNMVLLGHAASGLFVWASTAVRLVANSDNPFGTLEVLIRDTRTLNRFGLDELYATVLRGSGIPWESEASKTRFSRVLGLVILGKAPFTIDAMDAFLGFSRVSSSRLVLTKFRSLVSFSASSPIRLFHVSFADYLMSSERNSDPWSIDIPVEKLHHASRCFAILKDKLRFNICNIVTSHLPNNHISGLSARIAGVIPQYLEYASTFWGRHLFEVPQVPVLLSDLSFFAYNRFLYWLETMSLLEKVRLASTALLDAMRWISNNNAKILSFLRDARRMVDVFAFPISQSTPHIYISMLSITAKESEVAKHYIQRASSLVQVYKKGIEPQSSLLKVLEGHVDCVDSVAFSPDGTLLVSGSRDKTILIWYMDTGEIVSGPFEGYVGSVWSVAFSPDGKRIVVGGSEGISILDIETGKIVIGPFDESERGIISNVLFSPDGKLVIYGSSNLVNIRDPERGEDAAIPLVGHSGWIICVAVSREGSRIVSGSEDKTIRIWNMNTRELIREPFVGHTDGVNSVSFSPDGNYVVSGGNDQTIRIWNMEVGEVEYSPLTCHDGLGSDISIAVSPDGSRIFSGSREGRVRIWDLLTGQLIAGPFKGHTDWIRSVAFSPDGTRAVSGSVDKTIRIWETEGGPRKIESSPELVHGFYSVKFSSDDTRVISEKGTSWGIKEDDFFSGPTEEGSSNKVGTQSLIITDGMQFTFNSLVKMLEWDALDGRVLSPIVSRSDFPRCIAVSPNGKRVAFSSQDGTIRIWDKEDDRLVCGPFDGQGDRASLVYSPDGRYLTSGSDKDVRVWDVETGEIAYGPFVGHIGSPYSMAYSPDGRHIALASHEAIVRVWDIEAGRSEIFEGHSIWMRSVAYSSDGSYLVSSSWDDEIRVWDTRTVASTSELITAMGHDISSEINFSKWNLDRDGWIRGVHGELLLWVPPDLRSTLWTPRNIAILNVDDSTFLDFSASVHGEHWQECFHP